MPENSNWMYAAYAVVVAAYSLYAVSLWVRRRNVRRKLRGE